MTPRMDSTIDLKHYARVVWRRKGIILLCAVATLCATFITLMMVPREYESQVTLMIEESRLSRELEKVTGGIMDAPSRYGDDKERLSKLVGRIQSRPFLERVVRILHMDEDPTVQDKAQRSQKKHPGVSAEELGIRMLVENLQSRIRFAAAGEGIYRIIVADYSAANAQLLAKWISEIFVDISNQGAIERLKAAHEFGAEQLKIYEEQLHRSEEALERYKQSAIARTLRPSMVENENLRAAEALSRRIGEEQVATRVRLKQYSLDGYPELKGQDAILLASPKIRDLASRLSGGLKSELADRLSGSAADAAAWAPTGVYSVLRRTVLQEVEGAVDREFPRSGGDGRAALARIVFSKIDLEAQDDAMSFLRADIDSFKRQVESIPGGEIEQTRLENEVSTNRQLLQSFQAQLVASDVSQAVEMTKLGLQIEILDPANLPLTPSRPNRVKIILASLLLGPLLGICFAFAVEVADPTLRSLDDFARVVEEPVLGTTPLLSRLVPDHGRMRRHWVAATLVGIVVLTGGFFVLRESLLQNLITSGQPVRMVNPEKVLNADPR